MFRTWLLSGHYNSQCNCPGPGEAGHTHHLWKCFPRWWGRHRGKEECSHKHSKALLRWDFWLHTGPPQQKPEFRFQQTMWLLQQQDQPLTQYCCSLSTAHLATSVTKWDRFIKLSPLFPIAMVHLQGESLLKDADTGITASFGTGSSRVLSLETVSAGTADCRCWSCRSTARCCQVGLQFSGSHELKEELRKKSPSKKKEVRILTPNFHHQS